MARADRRVSAVGRCVVGVDDASAAVWAARMNASRFGALRALDRGARRALAR